MFKRFTVREIVILICVGTVAFVVVFAVVATIFRPLTDTGKEYVYQLVSGLLGLAAGLLAARETAKKMDEDKKEEK